MQQANNSIDYKLLEQPPFWWLFFYFFIKMLLLKNAFCDKITLKGKEYFMLKRLFLSVLVIVFSADFGAFAATQRSSRTTTNTTSTTDASNTLTTARSAVRSGTRTSASTVTSGTARAAIKKLPKLTSSAFDKNNKVMVNTVKASSVSAGDPIMSTGSAVRSAKKMQKVTNKSTSIAAATALSDTVVSSDCQTAYFGCMDSFCMVDNVTGGRCRCSDKITEYDNRVFAIQKSNEESYIIQTEGADLLKMGNTAEQIYAQAQAAADKVTKKEIKPEIKGVDLSLWDKKNNDDDDDIWEEEEELTQLDSDLVGTYGDKLHARAAGICRQQIPDQCKSSVAMLRMIYTQKIQSDCAAYANSLDKQEAEVAEKLQTARRGLVEIATEQYKATHKGEGECLKEFNLCMQGEETCGEGYLGCVTFAARDNLHDEAGGSKATQAPVDGFAGLTLAKTTLQQLETKAVFCQDILNTCVDVSKNVWTKFVAAVAPTLKAAELEKESELRTSCNREVSQCFIQACREQMDSDKTGAMDLKNPDNTFDMCLSNPKLFLNLCKPKLEPCLEATGGTFDNYEASSLWQGIMLILNRAKVTVCNHEVEECLLAEERCGKDYSGCIGLSTYEIGELCPVDVLTGCMADNNNDEYAVREYVAKVAQGIALNIENSILNKCEAALKKAMLTYCGAEDTCPNAKLDESMFKNVMHVELCKQNGSIRLLGQGDYTCYPNATSFGDADLIAGNVFPKVRDQVEINAITFDAEKGEFGLADDRQTKDNDTGEWNYAALKQLQKTLQTSYDNMVRAIQSDTMVYYCMNGRDFEHFLGTAEGEQERANKRQELETIANANPYINEDGSSKGRFPNLTRSAKNAIGYQLINAVSPIYFDTKEQLEKDKFAAMVQEVSNYINEKVTMTQEKQHQYNQSACLSFRKKEDHPSVHGCDNGTYITREPSYDPATSICTIKIKRTKRTSECHCGTVCPWKDTEFTETFILPKVSKSDVRDAKGVTDNVLKDETAVKATMTVTGG